MVLMKLKNLLYDEIYKVLHGTINKSFIFVHICIKHLHTERSNKNVLSLKKKFSHYHYIWYIHINMK